MRCTIENKICVQRKCSFHNIEHTNLKSPDCLINIDSQNFITLWGINLDNNLRVSKMSFNNCTLYIQVDGFELLLNDIFH